MVLVIPSSFVSDLLSSYAAIANLQKEREILCIQTTVLMHKFYTIQRYKVDSFFKVKMTFVLWWLDRLVDST
jgi:hypothetical protein